MSLYGNIRRGRRDVTSWLVLLAVGLLACISLRAIAIDAVQISVESARGTDWLSRHFSIVIEHPFAQQSVLVVESGALELPPPLDGFRELSVHCTNFQWSLQTLTCEAGEFSMRLLDQRVTGHGLRFVHHLASGRAEIAAVDIPLAGGSINVSAGIDAANWHLRIDVSDVALDALQAVLADAGLLVAALEFSGNFTGVIALSGRTDTGLSDIAIELEPGPGFYNEAGTLAADGLGGSLAFAFAASATGLSASGKLVLNSGEIFADPVCIEPRGLPLAIDFDLTYDKAAQRLVVSPLTLAQGEALAVNGSVELGSTASGWALNRLQLQIKIDDLGQVYDSYIRPCVFGTELAGLEVAGEIEAHIAWQPDGERSVLFAASEVYVDDQRGRFGIDGLGGKGGWSSGGESRSLHMSWSGGHLYQIDFGASRINALLSDTDLKLTQAVNLPILDGALKVENFALSGLGTDHLEWQFGGVLEPVSMLAFSHALGWPALGGSLSGVVPTVHYANDRMTVDGIVLMNVFDGDVLLRDLSLNDPFGDAPELRVSITVHPIDLEALTSAFEFGKIEGRIAGSVDDLYLRRWQPVSFDARFATPENDKSRHRISQRAVDNLSSLGGSNVAGTLSSTYLGFFKEFTYDRIGLSCRLQDGVCAMGGVADAENGYYIVKGGFIPPVINVLGYNHQVDWNSLLGRVRRAIASGGPVLSP